MAIRHEQSYFVKLITIFLAWAHQQGYEFTFGDAYRDPRLHGVMGSKMGYGSKNSNHKRRLAIDLNLFIEGRYCTDEESWRPLAEYWESLDPRCRSGIRFRDANHLEYVPEGWRDN